MDVLGGLLCLGMPAVLIIAIWATLGWILGPLNRAAGDRQYPTQYGLADLLCLFVLVQLPIGSVRWLANYGNWSRAAEAMADVMVGTVAVWLWWNTARLLSLAGVHTGWRRAVVLIVIVPCLIIGPLAVLFPVIMAIGRPGPIFLLAELPILGVLYLLGLFTRATVASAEKENREQEAGKEL
jgi:hypothetical protein